MTSLPSSLPSFTTLFQPLLIADTSLTYFSTFLFQTLRLPHWPYPSLSYYCPFSSLPLHASHTDRVSSYYFTSSLWSSHSRSNLAYFNSTLVSPHHPVSQGATDVSYIFDSLIPCEQISLSEHLSVLANDLPTPWKHISLPVLWTSTPMNIIKCDVPVPSCIDTRLL